MRVVIAGGHGQIAQHLQRRLSAAGHEAVGLIRNLDHGPALRANGAVPVELDLESADVEQLAAVLADADAVVFAAGAGPGSGPKRKHTVDHAAAVLLADAAQRAGVDRYVMISAMGVGAASEPSGNESWDAYVAAKRAADEDLAARDLRWTILRPGGLTDDPGSGQVALAEHTGRGNVPREDVAAVVAAVLEAPGAAGHTLELIAGPTPIAQAVAALR